MTKVLVLYLLRPVWFGRTEYRAGSLLHTTNVELASRLCKLGKAEPNDCFTAEALQVAKTAALTRQNGLQAANAAG